MNDLLNEHFLLVTYGICNGLKRSNLENHAIISFDDDKTMFSVDIDKQGIEVYEGVFMQDGHFFITNKEGQYLFRGFIKESHLEILDQIIETVLWSEDE